MKQPWKCEACGKNGVVVYARHADVITVMGKIKAAHIKHNFCGWGVTKIRVEAPQ